VARYEDLVRPVIDDHPLGFCKLIVERHRRYILGAHVLGVLDTHAEIAEHRPGCRRSSPTGTPVVALPLLRGSSGVDTTDLSVRSPAPTPSRRWSRNR
jgi:hypothetical protein